MLFTLENLFYVIKSIFEGNFIRYIPINRENVINLFLKLALFTRNFQIEMIAIFY